MPRFIFKLAIVSIGESARVEAKNFAAITDDVNAIAFHGGFGCEARLGPIEVRIFGPLWDDELPKERTALFVKAHEHSAIPLVFGIARLPIVRADVNATARDDRAAVRLRAEPGAPNDIFARLRIELGGELRLG
jgi:hypothetical protein